jgi:hypothetical protein
MFVGDVVSQIAYDPGFDGMGCRAPFVGRGGKNVKAAWMRKVEFLCIDLSSGLVSGRSYVGEREESVASWKCNCGREGGVRSGFIGHGMSSLMCGEVMKRGRQISNLDVVCVCVDGRLHLGWWLLVLILSCVV